MTIPQMIHDIMDRTGWKQAEVAARLGVEQATVSRWMKGQDPRGSTRDAIRKLHRAVASGAELDSMDVASLALAHDGGARMLPVLGYVGAGAEVHMVDDNVKGQGIDEVEAPPGASSRAIAVRVRGDSMLPAYHDGDHIVYDEQRSGDDLARYIGRECVVRLQDGRTFIKTVGRGATPGTWTLWSYNAAPMQDVIVEWAARVKWIERAG